MRNGVGVEQRARCSQAWRAVLAHTSQMRGRTEDEMLRFLRERARAVAPADAISPTVREAFRKVVFPR